MKKLLMMAFMPLFAVGVLSAAGNATEEGAAAADEAAQAVAAMEANASETNTTDANVTADQPAP